MEPMEAVGLWTLGGGSATVSLAMSDTPSNAAPDTSSPPPSQAAPVRGRSGYLTSTFGMTLAGLLAVTLLTLKDKLPAALTGPALIVLPAIYGFLRKERALGHAEIDAEMMQRAVVAASDAALGIAGPDAQGQARAQTEARAQMEEQPIGEHTSPEVRAMAAAVRDLVELEGKAAVIVPATMGEIYRHFGNEVIFSHEIPTPQTETSSEAACAAEAVATPAPGPLAAPEGPGAGAALNATLFAIGAALFASLTLAGLYLGAAACGWIIHTR